MRIKSIKIFVDGEEELSLGIEIKDLDKFREEIFWAIVDFSQKEKSVEQTT